MRAWQGWSTQPAMPVISAEARYEGLEINPDALDSEALCARAWALLEPQYRAQQAAWAEAFLAAQAKGFKPVPLGLNLSTSFASTFRANYLHARG